MTKKKLFLDIVVFGDSKHSMADALDHAAQQLRMGTPSESITWDDASHVTFDVRDATVGQWAEKRDAYLGDGDDK